ncbi:MAG: site-2 protease family protein [Candidatus Dormibacteria bacterium]
MRVLSNPQAFLIGTLFLLPALVLGFVLHEMAHAYVAVAQGDDTPRYDGRLSPDPRHHLEPIGLLMVLIIGFGYAKPVRINPSRMRGEFSQLLVALAGPLTNLVIAAAVSVPLRFITAGDPLGALFTPCDLGAGPAAILHIELLYIYSLNLLLFIFNLLPIPPLDGFQLVRALLRKSNPRLLFQIEANQQFIALGFFALLFYTGILGPVLRVVLGPLVAIFGVGVGYPCG